MHTDSPLSSIHRLKFHRLSRLCKAREPLLGCCTADCLSQLWSLVLTRFCHCPVCSPGQRIPWCYAHLKDCTSFMHPLQSSILSVADVNPLQSYSGRHLSSSTCTKRETIMTDLRFQIVKETMLFSGTSQGLNTSISCWSYAYCLKNLTCELLTHLRQTTKVLPVDIAIGMRLSNKSQSADLLLQSWPS